MTARPFTHATRAWLIAVTCLIAGSRSIAGETAAPATAPALTFTLKDQFDVEHTQAMCAGKITIVIEADRKGSQHSGNWSKAIGQALKPGHKSAVAWVGVATLRGIPSFVHGFVKKKFPREPSHWTLLDWDAGIASAYHLSSDRCNVLVFAQDGQLVHRAGGTDVDPAAVAAIVASVESLAAAPVPPPQ